MPVKQGGRLVELTPEVVKIFDQYLEEGRRTEPDFTKLINAILEDIIAKEEFLANEYRPNLELIAVRDNSMYIQNKVTRKVYEVTLDNDKVKCYEDKSDDCEHAAFALAVTEFGKIVRARNNLEHVMRLNKEAKEDKRSRHNQSSKDKDKDSDSESIFSNLSLRNLEYLSFPPLQTSVRYIPWSALVLATVF